VEPLAEYADATVALALYLTAYFTDAVNDLPDAPAGHLYRRFLGWVHVQR
jgi:hypothetical protein